MTDENKFDAQSRRKFLKTTGAVGVAATAGVGTFGGQAAAQNVNVDASDLQITSQQGQQQASGLINVQLQNLVVQDVLDVVLVAGDDIIDLDIKNIDILSDNEVNVAVADVVDVTGTQVQVAVTILGETTQGATQEVTGTDTVDIQQTT